MSKTAQTALVDRIVAGVVARDTARPERERAVSREWYNMASEDHELFDSRVDYLAVVLHALNRAERATKAAARATMAGRAAPRPRRDKPTKTRSVSWTAEADEAVTKHAAKHGMSRSQAASELVLCCAASLRKKRVK